MESVPEEIFDMIIMFCNPADYVNFILSYDRALRWFSSVINRNKYKRRFINKVIKYYKTDPNKIKKSYTLLTVPGYKNWVVKHYTQERYYINGELFSTTIYRRGEKHGKYCEFFRDDKVPKKIVHYYEGKRHGLSEEYYSSGIIFRKGIYIHGNKHGEHIENFNSGKPYQQCTYHQGKKLMPMKVQTTDRTKPPCIG